MAETANIIIDLERWPLVNSLVTGLLDDSDIAALFAGMEAAYSRREPFVMIADARGVKADNPKGARHRAEIAKFMQEYSALAKVHCVGMSVVLTSPTVALGLRALCTLVRPPVPIHTVASPQAAAEWSAERLKDRSLLTEELTRWLQAYRGW